MPTLHSKRLHLRPLVEADAQRIAELAGDWDVARMTGRVPYPYDADAARHWMFDVADGEQIFAITHDATLFGICGFTASSTQPGDAEIGYWIGREKWGQGFATEAARTIMAYGYTRAGIRRFTCCHFTDNPASRRVILKLGFRQIANARGWCEARQIELPTIVYEKRRPVWAAMKALVL